MSRYKVQISGINTAELKTISNKDMEQLFYDYSISKDEAIKEILIRGNLKLVLSLVQRFNNRSDNLDDLFQVGCIGLVKAIDHFDLKHEVRFSTYAVPMILGEIKRYLRDFQSIKIARNLKDLSYKIYQLKENYMHEFGEEPSLEYMSVVLQSDKKDIIDATNSMNSVISMYEPIYNKEGDEMYLLDQIKDEKDEPEMIHNILSLRNSLKKLNEKELNIIRKRFYEDLTQSEIADELNISQAQVSRLEKSAILELKKYFEL